MVAPGPGRACDTSNRDDEVYVTRLMMTIVRSSRCGVEPANAATDTLFVGRPSGDAAGVVGSNGEVNFQLLFVQTSGGPNWHRAIDQSAVEVEQMSVGPRIPCVVIVIAE